MNIIYHHRTQGKGVEGIHIRSIVKALEGLGHKVIVISPPGCNPLQDEKVNSGGNPKIIKSLFTFLSRNCPEVIFECLELVYNIQAYIKINREMRRGKIDFIYERYFLFSIASMILARKYKIPIIYEVNDSSFLPRLRRLKATKIANTLEKNVLSKSDVIITVSNHFKKHLASAGILDAKIIVSHNAIDPDIFNPEKVINVDIGISRDYMVLGFVGLFVEWSGLESLIHVFFKIHGKFSKTHLLLVGAGPEENKLRKIITDLGIQHHVTITGKVTHEEVPSYIHKMNICIIPKHETYTSPVKLFEYMAMGKPVLAPGYDSIKEVIKNGWNGMLFEPNNNEDLLNVLEEVFKNGDLLKTLGANAAKDVLENYTWRKNALQIEAEIEKIREK